MTEIVEVPNPFDPETLRLPQDFGATAGVKKLLNIVPTRKPGPQDFVRTHPSADYRVTTAVIELSDEGMFLVSPAVRAELSTEFVPVTLFTAITRQGTLFLWPCKLPGPDGRSNSWHESALDAAERARTQWIRMKSDRSLGAYQIYEPLDKLSEPEWPDYPFQRILEVAFRDRHLTSLDHPVVKRLRGRE